MTELFTVQEVAKALRVDDATVRGWINSGVLEAIRLPHLKKRQSYRVRQETLEKLLKG
ncbi:MAG TPA: helix-turn-helix domain-containing protein [Ktedonosporobacter sp.]|nr:helix-turn-helix domain-containing protein [Ktedonosporobacter sp.]